jgi:hypothetical protein
MPLFWPPRGLKSMSRMPVLILALALAACGGPAPYKPMEGEVGYGQQKLEANRYRVWFAGNAYTPRETVEDYVLFRTAELTLEEGYDYFVLSNRQTEGEGRERGGVSFGFGGIGFGRHSGIAIGMGTGTDDDRPKYYGQLDAVLMKGKKSAIDPQAFDAREVKANLEPRIDRGK